MGNKEIHIYRSEGVQAVRDLYDGVVYFSEVSGSILKHLHIFSTVLWQGVQRKDPAAYYEISNYHQKHLGKSRAELQTIQLKRKDAFQTIANEYGFPNWKAVESNKNISYDGKFEQAVNCLLEGNFEDLKALVEQNKYLLHQRSSYGHRATLLHYAASNGVELWRQQVPENLPDMTKYLLEMGADRDAKMNVYGGEFDTFALLKSSAHPFKAGIGEEMVALFTDIST